MSQRIVMWRQRQLQLQHSRMYSQVVLILPVSESVWYLAPNILAVFRIYWKEKLNILEHEFALQMFDPAHVSMRLPLAACKVSLAQRMETVGSEFPCGRNRLKVSLSNPNIKQFALLWGIAKQFPGKASRRPERFQEVTGSHYVKLHIYRTYSRLVTIFSSDPQSECK